MARKKSPPAADGADDNGAEISSAVKERLLWLEKRAGYLTPQMVVEDARNPRSPLHSEFEWEKNIAAERYWLIRARQLIRSVRVEIKTTHHRITAIGFLHDPSLPPSIAGYKSIRTLRADKIMAREALRQECLRAASALRRARDVAVALDLESEVESILAQVMRLVRAA